MVNYCSVAICPFSGQIYQKWIFLKAIVQVKCYSLRSCFCGYLKIVFRTNGQEDILWLFEAILCMEKWHKIKKKVYMATLIYNGLLYKRHKIFLWLTILRQDKIFDDLKIQLQFETTVEFKKILNMSRAIKMFFFCRVKRS